MDKAGGDRDRNTHCGSQAFIPTFFSHDPPPHPPTRPSPLSVLFLPFVVSVSTVLGITVVLTILNILHHRPPTFFIHPAPAFFIPLPFSFVLLPLSPYLLVLSNVVNQKKKKTVVPPSNPPIYVQGMYRICTTLFLPLFPVSFRFPPRSPPPLQGEMTDLEEGHTYVDNLLCYCPGPPCLVSAAFRNVCESSTCCMKYIGPCKKNHPSFLFLSMLPLAPSFLPSLRSPFMVSFATSLLSLSPFLVFFQYKSRLLSSPTAYTFFFLSLPLHHPIRLPLYSPHVRAIYHQSLATTVPHLGIGLSPRGGYAES